MSIQELLSTFLNMLFSGESAYVIHIILYVSPQDSKHTYIHTIQLNDTPMTIPPSSGLAG